ncbi:hypothetical protein [Galenea microaerophila]
MWIHHIGEIMIGVLVALLIAHFIFHGLFKIQRRHRDQIEAKKEKDKNG